MIRRLLVQCFRFGQPVGFEPEPGNDATTNPGGGGVGGSIPAAPAPAPNPAPAGQSSTGSPPGVATGVGGVSGSAPGQTPSPIHAGQAAGGLPGIAGGQAAPTAAEQQLAQMRAQLAQYQQQVSQYQRIAPYAQYGYEAYQRSNQQAQQPAQKKNPFGVPQFDQGLMNFLRKNPTTGELEVLPGGPPDLAARYETYQKARIDALDGLLQDPEKYLGELVDTRAQTIAQKLVQQHLGGYQEQQAVSGILQGHGKWIFEHDQAGRPVMEAGPNGAPARRLTAAGQLYMQAVQQAEQWGIRGAQQQDQFAQQQVKLAMLTARFQQDQAQQQGVQQGQQFVQQAQQQAVAGQAAQASPNFAAPPQQPTSLREAMLGAFRSNGITDQALAGQIAG